MRFKPKQAQAVATVIQCVEGPVEIDLDDTTVEVRGKYGPNKLGIPVGKSCALVGGGGKVTAAA